MKPSSTNAMSAVALRDAVVSGQRSAQSVVEETLSRLGALNGVYGALLGWDRELAFAQAATVDRGPKTGRLCGVPVLIKDNICVRGQEVSCGSRLLAGWRSPYDAHVIERLRAEGAIVLGRANMDEFAMGSSNENSAYHVVRNPWDLTRVPGGSSGGSAAAVAAGLVPLALGSDTGGSVRQPGAFCGVTAVKPTYGRVSRYGLVAFASSLDQIGPFAASPADAALALEVLAGHDGRDATSRQAPVPTYGEDIAAARKPLTIGRLVGLPAALDPAALSGLQDAERVLAEAGHRFVDIQLPSAEHAVAIYYIVASAEASSNLSRFDGVRYGVRVEGESLVDTYAQTRGQGFGAEVKRRIMLGTFALASGYYDAYYAKAQKVRTLLCQDFARAFAQCDAILSPTTPTPAFRLGEVADPLSMYLADIFTLPASLAGLPAISVPCAFADWEGVKLPLGAQLMGPSLTEGRLFGLADTLYRGLDIASQQQQLPDPVEAAARLGLEPLGGARAGASVAEKGGAHV